MSEYNDGEKNMLIESMAKLIEHIHDSKAHQTEIFHSLTSNDLLKILSNIEDTNTKLRKTSSRFLCELLYDNVEVQDLFCELTGLLPLDGKVCVNKIPEPFLRHSHLMGQILETIKNNVVAKKDERIPLCWYFSSDIDECQPLRVQNIFPQDVDNSEPTEFLDPAQCIFGFTIFSSYKYNNNSNSLYSKYLQEAPNKSITTYSARDTLRYHNSVNSSRLISPQKRRESGSSNSFIKKIQFNSSSSRQDRSLSEKREAQKAAQSQSSVIQDSLDGSIEPGYHSKNTPNSFKNDTSKNRSKLNEQSPIGNKPTLSESPSPMDSSSDKLRTSQTRQTQSPSDAQQTDASGGKPKLESGGNVSGGSVKRSPLAKREAGSSDNKQLKFKNPNLTVLSAAPTSKTTNSKTATPLSSQHSTSYSIQLKKKDTHNNTISSNTNSNYKSSPSHQMSLVHGIQVKKCVLPQENNTNSSTAAANSSFDQLYLKKLEQKYEAKSKGGYSLKDKRYSQPDEYSKNAMQEKRNAGSSHNNINSSSISNSSMNSTLNYKAQVTSSFTQPSTNSKQINITNNPYNLLNKNQFDQEHSLFHNQTPKFINHSNNNINTGGNSNNNTNHTAKSAFNYHSTSSSYSTNNYANIYAKDNSNLAEQGELTSTPYLQDQQFQQSPQMITSDKLRKKISGINTSSSKSPATSKSLSFSYK